MPLSALPFYLESKFEYETLKDNYFADMVRYATFGQLKDPQKLPRYWDLKQKKQRKLPTSKDYTVDEIIGLFAGKPLV